MGSHRQDFRRWVSGADLGDHSTHGGDAIGSDDLANLELSVDFLNGQGALSSAAAASGTFGVSGMTTSSIDNGTGLC